MGSSAIIQKISHKSYQALGMKKKEINFIEV